MVADHPKRGLGLYVPVDVDHVEVGVDVSGRECVDEDPADGSVASGGPSALDLPVRGPVEGKGRNPGRLPMAGTVPGPSIETLSS